MIEFKPIGILNVYRIHTLLVSQPNSFSAVQYLNPWLSVCFNFGTIFMLLRVCYSIHNKKIKNRGQSY